jgi:hypothetical protein
MPTEPLTPQRGVEMPASLSALRDAHYEGKRVAVVREMFRRFALRLHVQGGVDYFMIAVALRKLLDDCIYAAVLDGETRLPESEMAAETRALAPEAEALAEQCAQLRADLEALHHIQRGARG